METLALTNMGRAAFWRGKRVVLTGHTGFKGSWLTLWLNRLGADVTGISLAPATTPSLFSEARVDALCRSHCCDIRDVKALTEIVQAASPEIVFHLAAQPLVRASYREPLATFETNVMGTVHVLEALRGQDAAHVGVIVTTDKVYREDDNRHPYREENPLGGHDPYSASKAASELVIASYRDAFLSAQGLAIASARAGNVIGGGDWAEDRVVPDAVRAWQAGRPLEVRHPQAVRPWQHVLEPLAGYLTLAQKLWDQPALAGSYNFGPDADGAVTVRELVEMARRTYGKGEVRYGSDNVGPRESAWLALDAGKARSALGVAPQMTLSQAVERTMAWYRAHGEGADARALCEADILDFASPASDARSGADNSVNLRSFG